MASAFMPPLPVTHKYSFSLPRPRNGAKRFPLACATAPPSPPPIPTSLAETLSLASTSISTALSNAQNKLQLSALIPGLNPQIENTVPYSSQTLYRLAHGVATETPALASLPDVSILFPSAGGAASAANLYATEFSSENIRTASFYARDFVEGRVSQSANIIVSPMSSRGDRVVDDVDKVLAEAPGAIWVMLNPQLDLDRAAVGIKESTRRADLLKQFEQVFYFRSLFEIKRPKLIAVERGALLYTYGGPWQLFAVNDGYELVSELEAMPTVDEITTTIRRTRRGTPVKSDPAADAEFLKVLLVCACVLAATLGAIKFAGRTGF